MQFCSAIPQMSLQQEGFVGHGVLKGCSHCLNSIETTAFGEKADNSGFDTESWPKRDLIQHQTKGME